MKKNLLKKVTALLLVLAMLFTISACVRQTNVSANTKSLTGANTGKLFDDATEISMVILSHPSWPYNENWVFWKYFREAVGGKISLTVIPSSEIATKTALMMSSPKNLPDLIECIGKDTADKYSPSGALIAIDDYLDKMLNYTKLWNSVPKEEREEKLNMRKSADGKTYFPQIYGMDREQNIRSWMYRKDIFEKNGLTPPKTMDELYETALKLKKIYPESYPLCMRTGLTNFNVIGPEWKPYFTTRVYYDFNNEKWCYGAAEPTMLEMVKFFIKMREKGLIEPDYLTTSGKPWEELIFTNRGFMFLDYQVRIDFFNIPARQTNPEFTLDAMIPPKANTSMGQNMIAKLNVDQSGYIICNTGNQKRIDNAIRLVDWMYSDEAAELLSWGKEGETYKEVDGKRQFILGEGADANPKLKYGVHTYGLYLRSLPEVADAISSKEQAATTELSLKYMEKHYNPASWIALNDEELRVKNDIGTALDTYRDEMLSKFLLGQEPLSNWDSFQTELKTMGVDKLLDVYENAYNRIVTAKE